RKYLDLKKNWRGTDLTDSDKQKYRAYLDEVKKLDRGAKLISPDMLLEHSPTDSHNEVPMLGTSDQGSLGIAGYFVIVHNKEDEARVTAGQKPKFFPDKRWNDLVAASQKNGKPIVPIFHDDKKYGVVKAPAKETGAEFGDPKLQELKAKEDRKLRK